jgi:hypothetical protein
MRRRTTVIASLALALAGLGAGAAAASVGLTMAAAEARSSEYARHTCAHDPSCVSHGVLNCRGQGRRVALCRIYDERRTRVQGRYRCERLIRVILDPGSARRPIDGLGRWHC